MYEAIRKQKKSGKDATVAEASKVIWVKVGESMGSYSKTDIR